MKRIPYNSLPGEIGKLAENSTEFKYVGILKLSLPVIVDSKKSDEVVDYEELLTHIESILEKQFASNDLYVVTESYEILILLRNYTSKQAMVIARLTRHSLKYFPFKTRKKTIEFFPRFKLFQLTKPTKDLDVVFNTIADNSKENTYLESHIEVINI